MDKLQLLKLIHSGDLDTLANQLGDLNETQRRKLSTTASKWGRFLAQYGLGWEIKGQESKLSELADMGFDARTRNPLWDQAADLAILGCCPISQVKKINFIVSHDPQQKRLILKILADRNPEWIDELVEFKLTQQSEFPVISWNFVNELVEHGICQKPECDEYIVALTNALGYFANQQEFEDQVSRFTTCPEFFTCDVYRIFDVDSLAFVDSYCAEGQSWRSLIHRWINEEKLERKRIITCSIRSMSHAFRKHVVSAFCKFFESLQPTSDELSEHVPELGALLSSPNSVVVSTALKQLKKLHKSEHVNPGEMLDMLPAIFNCSTKSQPNSALSLILSIGTKDSKLVPSVLNATLVGMSHSNSDIQEKALSIFEKWAERAHTDHAITISQLLDSLSPALVARAKTLLKRLGADVTGVKPECETGEFDQLRIAASDLANEWAEICNANGLFDQIDEYDFPTPLNHSICDAPILSGVQPLSLVESPEDLIDKIAHAVEQVDSGIEAEILLDGIARHGLVKGSGEFADRVRPILQRIANQEKTEGAKGFLNSFDVAPAALPLFELALGKLNTGNFETWSKEKNNKNSLFFKARVESIFNRLKSSGNFQPLSTPTHEHGWIAPCVFVQRLNESFNAGDQVDKLDFVLALLRLAPENREFALQDLTNECTSDWRFMTSLALNADIITLETKDEVDSLLVNIAAHVRTKVLTAEECDQLQVHRKLVNGTGPSILSWKTSIEEIKDWSENLHDQERLDCSCNLLPPLSETPYKHMFWSLQGAKHYDFWELGSGWKFQLDDWNSKLSNDHYLLRAAHKLQLRIDDNSSMYDPNSDMLEALFEPDRVWTEIAHLAALLSLIGKDCDALGVGMDATIGAIEQGQANPEVMGTVIVKLFEHWSKRGRLAKSFAEISRMSPLHAWFVGRSLEPLIESFEPMPRDGAKVLEVYLDALVTMKLAPPERVGTVLAKVKGSSKAAKLAKKIVKLERGDASARQEAQTIAARARVERAKRWEAAAIPALVQS